MRNHAGLRRGELQEAGWQGETGRLESGNWKLETGNWKLEIGNSKLESGVPKLGEGRYTYGADPLGGHSLLRCPAFLGCCPEHQLRDNVAHIEKPQGQTTDLALLPATTA